MTLILNKKVVLLLYFTINIVQFIDCSTENHSNSDVVNESHTYKPIGTDAATVDESQNAAHAKHGDSVVTKTEHAKNVRNIGGVQHNYRSSYVGNRLNRRVASTPKQVDASTTEHIPLIKTKRKFDNEFNEEIKYNVGPGVNIGVEKEKELVSVYLDEDCLKDVFTGK